MVNAGRFLKGLLSAFFLLALVSCSRQVTSPLEGNWRLVSYCQPKTDSTCTPVVVPVDKFVLINLNAKGEFKETYVNTIPIHYAFLGCGSGSFRMEGSYLQIRALCMSSVNGKWFKTTFLDNNRLILNPVNQNRKPQTGEYILERQ